MTNARARATSTALTRATISSTGVPPSCPPGGWSMLVVPVVVLGLIGMMICRRARAQQHDVDEWRKRVAAAPR